MEIKRHCAGKGIRQENRDDDDDDDLIGAPDTVNFIFTVISVCLRNILIVF